MTINPNLAVVAMLISAGIVAYDMFFRKKVEGESTPQFIEYGRPVFIFSSIASLGFWLGSYTSLSFIVMVASGAVLFVYRFLPVDISREDGKSTENTKAWYIEYAQSIFPFAIVAFLIFWLQDLPLLLFLSVAYTGLFTLADFVYFRKRRAPDQAEHPNLEYSKSFFPVLLIVFVIRSFLIEPFQIPSESMVPTLEVGDFIVVNKFTYGIRLPVLRKKIIDINDPKRGDVMVFFPPNEDRYFIKRVIGLPGDKITYNNKMLTVNGQAWPQSFVGEDSSHEPDNCEKYFASVNVLVIENIDGVEHETRYCKDLRLNGDTVEVVVPQGHYFMMGDNRDNSADSRVWGTVPEERIVGKAFARWMYWKNKLSLPSFSRAGYI